MIVLANLLIIISIFTLFSYPLVFALLQWNVIYYDGLLKGVSKHELRIHQIYALILPFGLGLLQYYQKTKNIETMDGVLPIIELRHSVWIKNFKVMLALYPVLLTLSTILMVYLKYL